MSTQEIEKPKDDVIETMDNILLSLPNPPEEFQRYIRAYKAAQDKEDKIKISQRILDDTASSDSSKREEDDVKEVVDEIVNPTKGKRSTRNPNPLYEDVSIEDSDDENDSDFDEERYDEKTDRLSNVVP